MPIFKFQGEDGKIYRVEGPEGTSPDEVAAFIEQQIKASPAPAPKVEKKPLAWSDVPAKAWENAGTSAVEFGKSIVQPILHPIETAKAVGGLAYGLGSKAVDALPGVEMDPDAKADREKYADAMGQALKGRYGGLEEIKNTLATDPVGAAADLATVLSGGGALAARAPGMAGQVGRIAQTAGRVVDPLTKPGQLAKGVGKTANFFGSINAGLGFETLPRAWNAGARGSDVLPDNMRGLAPQTAVLDMADSALKKKIAERGAEYRASRAALTEDKTVLDYAPIRAKLAEAENIAKFHGVAKNDAAAKALGEILAKVDEFENIGAPKPAAAKLAAAVAPKADDVASARGIKDAMVANKVGADEAEAILQQYQYVKSMSAKAPQSLADFVIKRGGLQNQGEVRSMLGGSGRNRPGLLNDAKGGATLDDMAHRAWEAGFLPGESRPSINAFLEALGDDVNGVRRVVRHADESLLDDLNVADEMRVDLERLGITSNTPEHVVREALGLKEPTAAPTVQAPPVVDTGARPGRTAEGLDALKQAIGDIRLDTKQGTTARAVADAVYNEVKGQIAKQVPEYAGMMRRYSDASDTINELRKTLSLNEKATADTQLRKLLSTTRNNVNTNYGQRTRLIDELAKYEPDLPDALHGQALNSNLPRGLASLPIMGAVSTAAATMNPLPLASIPFSIPHVAGEVAYRGGQAQGALARALAKAGVTGTSAKNAALAAYLASGVPTEDEAPPLVHRSRYRTD
jgi:hypothetical protein